MLFELKHFVILLFVLIKMNNRRKANIKRFFCVYENLISLLCFELLLQLFRQKSSASMLELYHFLAEVWISFFACTFVTDTRGPLTQPAPVDEG